MQGWKVLRKDQLSSFLPQSIMQGLLNVIFKHFVQNWAYEAMCDWCNSKRYPYLSSRCLGNAKIQTFLAATCDFDEEEFPMTFSLQAKQTNSFSMQAT